MLVLLLNNYEMKTAQEIIDLLKEDDRNLKDCEMDFDGREFDPKIFGQTSNVHHRGGEDEGSRYVTVVHFIDHDVYIEQRGYYSSYEGPAFDSGCYKQVFPQDKVVTVYTER